MTEPKATEEFEQRPYQQAIVDVCIQRNSIVYLPTGAGKSYIAIQVIKHFDNQLELKYSEGGKRSIFLVNTVCLAKQQAESIRSMLSFEVTVLCGENNVDNWVLSDWLEVVEENQILVATAQVILDAVKRSFLKLEQINVMVFDECHHGRKDHPYHELMKQFKDIQTRNVRIIGLSGMLIGNDNKIKPDKVEEELRKLEATYESTVITVNNLDDHANVLMCSTNAVEGVVRFQKQPTPPSVDAIVGILEAAQEKLKAVTFSNYTTISPKSLRPTIPKKVKELILMLKDFKYQASEMGPYGGYLTLLNNLIQFELIKRFCDTERHREVVRYCITVTERCISEIELGFGINRKDSSVVLKNSSHKVDRLIALLRQKFTDPNRERDLQCIVFVKQRSTAKAIYHVLKALASFDPSSFPIVPDFMVGVNNELPESIEALLSTNYNSITLEKFKNRETNCIVSTSVLEEGIDLQMCNLVVMYDKPDTYRSYVQARGRARVNNSTYVVLVDDGSINDFLEKVKTWREVDKELKSQLLMKTLDREPPSEEEIQSERGDCWPPFIIPSSGACLNNLNSVSLLNHYALKMPSDVFTNISVFWRRIDHEDKTISAALQLPSQSVIKEEIIGDPQSNVKLAKQHAAFKACQMLYQHKELNDNLVPVDDTSKIEECFEDYFAHWKDYAEDKKSAGTRNHRRYHKIKTPDVLINSAPHVNKQSFLYRIVVRPKFDIANTNLSLETFHELFGNGSEFGILTSRRIPKLCSMRLFQSYGEIEVEIKTPPMAVTVKTQDELKILRNFHVAIFRDVLNTWMPFYVLDTASYLIVPLNDDAGINWKLAADFQKIEQPRHLTYDDIQKTDFTFDAYHHRVVNPVYRDTDQKYVVLAVHEHLSPMSPFPNDEYSSYEEYYRDKFSKAICKLHQPLIEVKGIRQDLNLFFPGAGVSGKQRKQDKYNVTEHYIPELCHNFKFPADYWLKATLLPSICHRMELMLLAEELRSWLIREGIDNGRGPQDYKLDIDYGSYDDRENALQELQRQHKTFGKLSNLRQLKEQMEKQQAGSSNDTDTRHTKAVLLRDQAKLPIDIDRNWLSVTEVDIDYYFNFLKSNPNKISPVSFHRIQKLIGSPPNPDRFLMDVDDRADIKIIHLDGKHTSVMQKDLIKVLTTANAGDVFDMERFEVLGDGFLKFICSLFLYKKYETWHEGYLTSLKGRLVSNRNLFYVGNNFGLSQMLKTRQFKAKESPPQSIMLPSEMKEILENDKTLLTKLYDIPDLSPDEVVSGQLNAASLRIIRNKLRINSADDMEQEDDGVEKSMLTYINQHHVGDKIVADAVEAFIGVVIHSLGIQAGLKLCLKLKILAEGENFDKLLVEAIPPRMVQKSASPRDGRVHNRPALQQIIGYTFNDPLYLTQALTHASYPIKVMGSYQQLEFLGDAVLDFLITAYISEQCPHMDPGKLTDLRSALVNNVTLACIVVRNGIHKFLLAENLLLQEAIKKFCDFQAANDHCVVLDQIIMLETEDDTSTAESVDIPKVIGDLFESIVGAVFLDCGLDLTTTWNVIYGLMKKELREFMTIVPLQIVRQLFEYEKGSAEPKFWDAETYDEHVCVPVEILCRGEKKILIGIGKNKTLAKKCAAKLALKALTEQSR